MDGGRDRSSGIVVRDLRTTGRRAAGADGGADVGDTVACVGVGDGSMAAGVLAKARDVLLMARDVLLKVDFAECMNMIRLLRMVKTEEELARAAVLSEDAAAEAWVHRHEVLHVCLVAGRRADATRCLL